MRLSLAAARKYALIICIRLLAVISMHLLTVYIIGYDPLLFVRAFNLHARTDTMTVLLCAFKSVKVFLVCSSSGWPSRVVCKEWGASAHAIILTREHKSTNLTYN